MNLPEAKVKVAIADDHRLFRDGIRRVIQSGNDGEIVMEAANGDELLQLLRRSPQSELPDVILLDVNMPIMDGSATAEILKTEFPKIKVLVLSMHTDENIVVTLLKLGVSGYINKNVDSEELLTAIREIYDGNRYFSSLVVKVAMNYLSGTPDSLSQKLSQREMQIVHMIFKEKTSEEISKELFLSKRTVDNFMATIMAKLKVNTRVGIVLAALKKHIVNLEGEPLY